ncbi:MAG: hypothetical protein Q7J68_00825 [Thermoplasmata archaeon]|nr:hypothetical protein [Thermoplasmata archaeon]
MVRDERGKSRCDLSVGKNVIATGPKAKNPKMRLRLVIAGSRFLRFF